MKAMMQQRICSSIGQRPFDGGKAVGQTQKAGARRRRRLNCSARSMMSMTTNAVIWNGSLSI